MAEALQGSERFMSKLGAVHGCSGGALVGALLLCPGALVKVKEYVASGRALRGMGLKELWDPALLIPRAVEARRSAHMAQAVQESGALTEDTHRILSGRLHVHCTRGGFFRGEPVPSPGGDVARGRFRSPTRPSSPTASCCRCCKPLLPLPMKADGRFSDRSSVEASRCGASRTGTAASRTCCRCPTRCPR